MSNKTTPPLRGTPPQEGNFCHYSHSPPAVHHQLELLTLDATLAQAWNARAGGV